MKKLLLLFGLIVSLSFIAAATPCSGVPYTLTGVPGGSVSCGPLTFTDFWTINATPGAMATVTPASMWDPSTATAFLNFGTNLASAAADILIGYSVTGASILNIDAYVLPAGPTASTSELVCAAGTPFALCSVSNALVPPIISTGQTVWASIPGAPTSVVIKKDIAGPTSTFTQSFHTPEPMSFVLLGSGLLGLGLVRRRRA